MKSTQCFKMEVFAFLFAFLFHTLLFTTCALILLSLHWRKDAGTSRVQVIVMGDVGRSPRMQYHCLSLVQQLYNVDYIGYGGKLRGTINKSKIIQMC